MDAKSHHVCACHWSGAPRVSRSAVCVCLPGAGSSGLCHLPVRGCRGTHEPAERGAIDQVPRQGPQRGREPRAALKTAAPSSGAISLSVTPQRRPAQSMPFRTGGPGRVWGGMARYPRGKSTLPLTICSNRPRAQGKSCRAAISRAWPAIRGATPYTSRICPRVPSRPPNIALLTLYCCISFTLPVRFVHPLPLCLPKRVLQLPCQPRDLCVSIGSERLQVISFGALTPLAVTVCRHLSPNVVTVCRCGLCPPPPHSPSPAAQSVMARPMAGG